MIIFNRGGPFGSRTALIENGATMVTVNSAKEGLFKGLSTVILLGKLAEGRLILKITYWKGFQKSSRLGVHDLIVKDIDEGLNRGMDVVETVRDILDRLGSLGIVKDAWGSDAVSS